MKPIFNLRGCIGMSMREFAEMLNNRYERNEITKTESQTAKALGYVIVFGASDDLMEFTGAIDDEFGCFNGGTAYITKDGLFEDCECECKYSEKAKKETKEITAIWCDTGEYAWTYETDIPHVKFNILDNDEGNKWCQGIVFDINRLEKDGGVDEHANN